MLIASKWVRPLLVASLLVGAFARPAHAVVRYVSAPTNTPAGSDSNPGTLARPYATIQKAASVVLPGDTVLVRGGTYTNACPQCDVVNISRAGTAAAWIVFRNYPGERPLLRFNSWNGFALKPGAAYIEISGFRVQGNNANVTLTAAQNQNKSCADDGTIRPGPYEPIYNGNGITADGRSATGGQVRPHHLRFLNNEVFECGGAGISAIQSDYVTVEGNLIYNNSWYTIFGTSGISLYQLWNFDAAPGYHNLVSRNRCFGNRLYVKWSAVCAIYDGNGIIIDDSRNTQNGSTIGAYSGRTLIANNVVANNGGSGIHTYESDHIDIINNTAYQNQQTPEINSGDIFANSSADVVMANNILLTTGGKRSSTNYNNLNITRRNNLYFGGIGPAVLGTAPVQADPRFRHSTADWATADFRLLSTSPAINTGSATAAPNADFDGLPRPSGAGYDIGAFEYDFTPTISGFSPISGPVGATVTVSGTNFTGATAVFFNGISAPYSVTNATSITSTVPPGATTGTIRVTTASGTAISSGSFTVTSVIPTGLSFTPAGGAPGSVVLLTGPGFTTASDARFNSASATGTVYNSPTTLTATVPGGANSGPLTVTTGAATLTGASFTVLAGPAPRLTQFSPLRAPIGVVLTLTGNHFTGATNVRFGAVEASGFTVVSPTQITVPVPVGAVSGARIYVLTTSGGMAQSARPFTLIPPPTLSAMFPSYGTALALVQLTGTDLTNATNVSFNGTDATDYTVNSATSLTATIPIGAASGPITVTTVAGTATTVGAFTVNTTPAAPTISNLTPAVGPVGAAVVVGGTSLNGASLVLFGAKPAAISGVPTANALNTNVPAGATTAPVWVLTPGGLTKSAMSFHVTSAAASVSTPTLTSLLPTFGSPGARVLLRGTNWSGTTAVAFTGTPATFSSGPATGLTATVPAGVTSGPVTVTTTGGTSNGLPFSATTPAPPTVTGFTPASGPVGQVVTVSGSGFSGATQGVLNGTVLNLTDVSDGSASFTVPAGATTGLVGAIGAGGLMLSAMPFTVVPAPTITAFAPASGSPGSVVTLTGTNLTGATSVRFGGVNAPTFGVSSATSLTVTVPAGASTGALGVTTAGGAALSSAAFTVTAPAAPTISGFSPNSGILGTWVTVTGTNFTGTTQVRFHGKVAESFVVQSATSLVVAVPDQTTTGPITVRNAGGEAVSATPFTVTVAPDIDAFTPVRGPVGTVLTLTGEGFTGTTSLTVGGTAMVAFTAISDRKLTATVPPGALSGQLTMTTPVATGRSAQDFTVTGMRVDTATSVPGAIARLALYPNPASGTVTVYLQEWERGAPVPPVELFDALGRRLRRVTFPASVDATTVPVTLLGVPTGIYLVRCGLLNQRLVVE